MMQRDWYVDKAKLETEIFNREWQLQELVNDPKAETSPGIMLTQVALKSEIRVLKSLMECLT